MKRLCLITHCEATHSIEEKVGGWFDSDLTLKGRQQASQLPSKVEKLGFDLDKLTIYSSDLNSFLLKLLHFLKAAITTTILLELLVTRRVVNDSNKTNLLH